MYKKGSSKKNEKSKTTGDIKCIIQTERECFPSLILSLDKKDSVKNSQYERPSSKEDEKITMKLKLLKFSNLKTYN